MSLNNIKILFVLPALALAMASCQDHHWKPYSEVGEMQISEKPFQGPLASGKIDLGGSVKANDYKGWYLFIVMVSSKSSTLFAVAKQPVDTFPITFAITGANIIVGKPSPDEVYRLEARLDQDGEIETGEEIAVFGKVKEDIKAGQDNILIVLDLPSEDEQSAM